MNDDIQSELTRLPEPDPPATFSRTVMARVARAAEERNPAWQAPALAARHRRKELVGTWTERVSRAIFIAGVAIVFASWTYGIVAGGPGLNLVPLWPWLPAPMKMPLGGAAGAGLALGLLLYVTGLFAPLRNKER